MADTRRIRKAIEAAYSVESEATIDVPLELQAVEMAHRAKDYVAAATILENDGRHWLPRVQLTGQAVELALKACLASRQISPPRRHDLLELYERVERIGVELTDSQYAAIVHLQHFYLSDLKTGTRFKTRYPTERDEALGGAVPNAPAFEAVVGSLTKQASEGNSWSADASTGA